MKIPFKMLACVAAVATIAFWSCDININANNMDGNASNIQQPNPNPNPDPIGSPQPEPMPQPIAGMSAMDGRVVSYQIISHENYPEWNSANKITTDEKTLKLWFPNVFNGNQKDECNYFAVYSATSSTNSGYKFISEDMRFCSLVPNPALNEFCVSTEDIVFEAILACDDKEGTLRTNLQKDMESRVLCSYVAIDWKCGYNDPKKLFF